MSFMALIIFVMLARGPAMKFIIAKMRSQAILMIVGKDRHIDVKVASYKGGAYYSKNPGYFLASPGATYTTRAGRVAVSLGIDTLGTTLDLQVSAAMQSLKKAGVQYEVEVEEWQRDDDGNLILDQDGNRQVSIRIDRKQGINNISDYQAFMEYLEKHRAKIAWSKMNDVEKKKHASDDGCQECRLEHFGVPLNFWTVNLHDVAGWITRVTSPAAINAQIDDKVRLERMDERGIPAKYIFILIIVIFGGVIAAGMYNQFLFGGGPALPSLGG